MTYEFRVPRESFKKFFGGFKSKPLAGGDIHKVLVDSNDPRLTLLSEQGQKLWDEEQERLFYGWTLTYSPSDEELEAAPLLGFQIKKVFEPTGEECGTVFSESSICPQCKAGGVQVGPLRLRKIPVGVDVCRTFVNEEIFSERIIDALREANVSGAEFRQCESPGGVKLKWFQIFPKTKVLFSERTQFGEQPLVDHGDDRRCSIGSVEHLVGATALGALYVQSSSWSQQDFVSSASYIWGRSGLFRPIRLTFVSQRVYQIFRRLGIEKIKFHPVYLVP